MPMVAKSVCRLTRSHHVRNELLERMKDDMAKAFAAHAGLSLRKCFIMYGMSTIAITNWEGHVRKKEARELC